MAQQTFWIHTHLPQKIVDIFDEDIKSQDLHLKSSSIRGNIVNENIRNCKSTCITTSHWIAGFIWHYIQKANNENFRYEITNIENELIQYISYSEGEFYSWHQDDSMHSKKLYEYQKNLSQQENEINNFLIKNSGTCRKLSFSLNLSDYNDYTGGNLQLLSEDGESYFAPRTRGTITIFDSRTPHRVQKIKSGTRKTLVGWVVGPEWR